MAHKKLDGRNAGKIDRLYRSGLSQIKIAAIYGTTAQVVCEFMKRYGIRARTIQKAVGDALRVDLTTKQVAQIWTLYNKALNRREIASQLGITEWAVRKTIQGKCRGRAKTTRLQHKVKTIPLTLTQTQLILGSLLGDASLVGDDDGGISFQMSHCLEQKDYLKHKASILGSSVRSYVKGEGSYSKGKRYYITQYHNKYELLNIRKQCFKGQTKTVNSKWTDALDIPAIAYWFMDDGSSVYRFNKQDKISCIIATFSTLSFSNRECKLLQKRLAYFGIETTLQSHPDGAGNIIAIRSRSIPKFMDLVEPYIVSCMRYKIKRKTDEPRKRTRTQNSNRKG